MKRKVVKLGPATLVVSLPSKWTKKFSVKAGDELDLEEEENKLVIVPGGVKEKLETSISLSNHTESSIRTMLTNAYRLGYDSVRVAFDTEKQFQILNDVVKTRLIGFEVIKKEKGSCVIENLTEPSGDQFETLMQKVLYNVSELLTLTKQRFKKEEPAVNYEELEEKMQQYDNFCRRAVSKGKVGVKNPMLFWSFIGLIIHGQREIYHLNKYLDKNKVNISKDSIKLLDECSEIFELVKKAYLGKDMKPLEHAHTKEKEAVITNGYPVLAKQGKESIVAHRIMASARQFYLSSSPLMGLLL